MSKIYLFLGLLFSLSVSATSELMFEKIIFNRDDAELSGLLQHDDELLFVADKLSNRAIYKVRFENDRFFYTNHLNISKLQGHNSYFAKALLFKHGGRIVKSPFDLEGLTYCNENFYIANEQARHVLKVNKKSITKLEINFNDIFKKLGTPLEKISTNAGFEGIAIDCKNQVLYIAQERQPRAIIVVDLKTNTPIEIFQTAVDKGNKITPSYADIHFENGFLYLLERNAHLITKIDIKTKKIISKFKFGKTNKLHLKDIYDTGEPYGLAEGLTMDKNRIYIAVDNNKNLLTKKAQAEYKLKGNFSSIMIYQRPKGF